MKFIHISDLHIGKKIHEFSMLEDQKYILDEILHISDDEKPDAVLIAGDIYDKSIPPTDAVQIFDDFIVNLSKRNIKTFIISGNHDSAERISFGGRLMEYGGIYISPVYDGNVEPIKLTDEYGNINIYMLPFIKPIHVRTFFPDEDINSYTDAVETAIKKMDISCDKRNILITHQFVTGASKSDSEDMSVGGSDNVDADVFDSFDYVALGHIHGRQHIRRNTLRYCGTPLKYSFSECNHVKSVTVVTMKSKNDISISQRELKPIRDMKEIKGLFSDIMLNDKSYDYIHVILTDENEIPDAISEIRKIYPNIMCLTYDNTRTQNEVTMNAAKAVKDIDPKTAFSDFYRMCNGSDMNKIQIQRLKKAINDIWGM